MAPLDGMTQTPAAPGQSMPQAGGPPNQPSGKVPEAEAGYMELAGAQKDGDCQKVDVQGGISLDLGCCNLFEPQDESVDSFRCGTCKYGSGQKAENDATAMKAPTMGADHPLQQLRAKPKFGMGA